MSSSITVSGLFIYPIKSGRGVPITTSIINENGFEFDRQWIVIYAETNKLVTQREIPKMVLVQPSIDVDAAGGRRLHVTVSGDDKGVSVPIRTSFDGEVGKPVHLYFDTSQGVDEGDEIAAYLSAFLGASVRLVVKDPRLPRKLYKPLIPDRAVFKMHEPQTGFADGFPFLILSSSSVSDLNTRLAAKDPAIRQTVLLNFRPNIVLSGTTPFEEDTFKIIRFNGDEKRTMLVVARCDRCQVPTNDLDKGELDPKSEPLKTMQSFRRVDPGSKYKAMFGVWGVQLVPGWSISVGDSLNVLDHTTEHNQKGKEANPDFWKELEVAAVGLLKT